MTRKSKNIIATIVGVGALAAGGTAFTASNNMTAGDQTLGYGSATITGATATSVDYNLSADGSTIETVDLVLAGPADLSGKTVKAGFDAAGLVTCAAGVFTTSTAVSCDITDAAVATATSFNVLVTD